MVEILALLSLLGCIALTVYAAKETEENGGQSIRDSMVEAWTNVAIGFGINYVANLLILPLVTEGVGLWENLMIGWIYTVISMIRSFLIRRWNNRAQVRNYRRLHGST